MTSKSHHLMALDGLRGLAALVVLGYHWGLVRDVNLAPLGYLAVDFFFMLSGFVIALSYERKLQTGAMPRTEFWRRRVIRLYPMIALGASLGAVAQSTVGGGVRPGEWLAFVMVPVLGVGELFPVDGPLWSLFLELIGNAVHVVGLPWLGRRALVVVIACGAVGMLASLACWGWLNVGWSSDNVAGGLARIAFGYFGGVLLCRLWLSGLRPPGWLPIWIAPVIVLSLFLPFPSHLRGISLLYVAALLPLALVAGLHSMTGARVAAVARALGVLSYPLYAVHFPLLLFARFVTSRLGAPLAAASGPVAIVAVSYGLGRFYDPAGQRILRRLIPIRGA